MILDNKLITKHILSCKIRRNLDDIDVMRKSLKDYGFSDEDVEFSILHGMKEKHARIFKLKKKLLKIKKK